MKIRFDAEGLFWTGLVCLLAVHSLLDAVPDSSDTSFWHRSGLRLHRDGRTGCEYFSSGPLGLGGLTPRLGPDGRQICASGAREELGHGL